MVDFGKRLRQRNVDKVIDPISLYDTLDRASDKGPLRPVQEAILQEWHSHKRQQRDVIVKLHTGQGKTLIGLLMLQSIINDMGGVALYLCPNKQLVQQSCRQAQQFGISFTTDVNGELPEAALDGGTIYIGSVQKLFNGRTQFGLDTRSIDVSAILLDDSHACVDSIRNALRIQISRTEDEYRVLRDMFAESLKSQGRGTFAGIMNGDPNEYLSVPYWAWQDKQAEVAETLAKRSQSAGFLKFTWQILKDELLECQCLISGNQIDIVPYLIPLSRFGSYYKAKHRIFMSATVTDDSFLVKGLEIDSEAIRHPLSVKNERWSGEKMILIPSLIDESLDASVIRSVFGKPDSQRRYGVVTLTPSFEAAKSWEVYKVNVAKSETIDDEVSRLLAKKYTETLVVVNRYDGIDLPDDACRILIIDGNPQAENLIDRYSDDCRGSSTVTAVKHARIIEQGLGRSVRGEKDYCAILLIGPSLIRMIRTQNGRKFLSNQTRAQVELGLSISMMAKEDVGSGKDPRTALEEIINQLINRDSDWKEYYAEEMKKVNPEIPNKVALEVFQQELEAERKYRKGDIDGAVQILQHLSDSLDNHLEKGWYLQEIARYIYKRSTVDSNRRQLAAHNLNRRVLLARDGIVYKRIKTVSQRRMQNIIEWIQTHENHQELIVSVEGILDTLVFGAKADSFERALNDLAKALGFSGERPDKEWGEGPDNLWALRDDLYLNIECKNEVDVNRRAINEDETEQMNRSYAWFNRSYPNIRVINLIIHPSREVKNDAGFLTDVKVMRVKQLNYLRDKVRSFFSEFRDKDFKDLDEGSVQSLVDNHQLSVDALSGLTYMEPVRQRSA